MTDSLFTPTPIRLEIVRVEQTGAFEYLRRAVLSRQFVKIDGDLVEVHIAFDNSISMLQK